MTMQSEAEFRQARLEALVRERYGGDKSATGRALGFKDGAYVGQMLRGDRAISEKLVAKVHGMAGLARWFSRDKAAAPDVIPAVPQSAGTPVVTIPQFETGGAMGHGIVLQDQPGVIRSWTVSPEWVQQNVHRITSPKNLAIVTGFGDSMRPLYNPGDPLLVDRGITRADIDGVYFFRVDGEGFVKRLQRIPIVGGVIIRAKSENKQYDTFDIFKGMDFEVFGRVVKAWRGEDF